MQIPQDDTRVEDVVKEFKNQNKVVDTIASLRDKGEVIAGVIDGQGCIRRLLKTPLAENSDISKSELNR